MEREYQTYNRFCSHNLMRPGGISNGRRMTNNNHPPSPSLAIGADRKCNSDSYICPRNAAPTFNNHMRRGGISSGRMINDNYPPSPTLANGPVRKSNSASVAPYSDTPTTLVDVDKIVRLKQLNNSVYLVSRSEAQMMNHRASETRDEDGVQLGVVVNDPPISSETVSPVNDVPPLNEDQIPQSMQRLVLSLKRQVQSLQVRLDDVETEFQVRYQREKDLFTKVNGLIESSNVTKCDQATQVANVQSPEHGRRDVRVESFGLPDTVPSSCTDPVVVQTTSLDVGRNQETFDQDLLPSGVFNDARTSTPLVRSDDTLDPRLMAARHLEASSGLSSGYWPDSSNSESEENGRMKTSREYTRRRRRRGDAFSGDLARRAQKRPRQSSSGIITLYDSSDSGNFSDFPPEHPFRYSMSISKPPKVPANYCDACYHKIDSKMIGKFCFACSSRVERLKVAYIANKNTGLPFCDHPMSDPKRRCRGCIFKVYTYRYNRRNPTNLLPFPKMY